MNHPFNHLDDLWFAELDLVPDHLYYQALAFRHCPEHWLNEANVRRELELESFREHHIRNIWAMLHASFELIEQYLSGALIKGAEPEPDEKEKPPLDHDQLLIVEEIVDSVEEGWRLAAEEELRWKGEDAEEPMLEEDPFANQRPSGRRAFAVLGPAGSGKTSAIEEAVRQVHEKGGRVGIFAPTGKLAASFKQKYPTLDVDTLHGAFALWKPIQQTLELMMPYDLVIVKVMSSSAHGWFHFWGDVKGIHYMAAFFVARCQS